METQIYVGLLRTLIGVLNSSDDNRDLALLLIGGALASADIPVGGLVAFYRAAREVSSMAGPIESELSAVLYQNILDLLKLESEIEEPLKLLKEVYTELRMYESSEVAQA